MAGARSFNLTVGPTPVRLSDVYIGQTFAGPGGPADVSGGGGVSKPDVRTDLAYRQIILQAVTADIQIGATSAVTTSTYGVNVSSNSTVPPISIGPWETGPVKLSDLWAVCGTSGTLHILGIPF